MVDTFQNCGRSENSIGGLIFQYLLCGRETFEWIYQRENNSVAGSLTSVMIPQRELNRVKEGQTIGECARETAGLINSCSCCRSVIFDLKVIVFTSGDEVGFADCTQTIKGVFICSPSRVGSLTKDTSCSYFFLLSDYKSLSVLSLSLVCLLVCLLLDLIQRVDSRELFVAWIIFLAQTLRRIHCCRFWAAARRRTKPPSEDGRFRDESSLLSDGEQF